MSESRRSQLAEDQKSTDRGRRCEWMVWTQPQWVTKHLWVSTEASPILHISILTSWFQLRYRVMVVQWIARLPGNCGELCSTPVQGMVKFLFTHDLNYHCKQEVRGLEGHICLTALQPLPCLSRSYVGREGHGHPVYQYIWPRNGIFILKIISKYLPVV